MNKCIECKENKVHYYRSLFCKDCIKDFFEGNEKAKGHHRGNPMHQENGIYVYTDTKQPVKDNPNRTCGHCGKENTPEGHDSCLGILPYVMNACCGHGDVSSAYVQFKDGSTARGQHALNVMRSLK